MALVTLTVMSQLLPAGIAPPVSASEVPLAAAVTVPLQPAPLSVPAGAAVLTRPAGYASVNAAPVIAVLAFGLVSVIFSTAVAPAAIVFGVNDFSAEGANGTVKVALAAAAFEPALVARPPAAIVFVKLPPVLATTLTAIVQPPLAMLAPLASVILVSPGVAVTPTQVPTLFAGFATVTFAGSVSVKVPASVIAPAFGLPSVIVAWFGVFGAIGPALANALLSVGAASTVPASDALALLPLPPSLELGALLVLV